MQIDPVRVEVIFEEALKKADAAARAVYLDQACAGDDALRARVEALLSAHHATANFLTLPREDFGTDPAVALSQVAGSRIGRYRLLEQIGEGGFGVVFMAEQTEPVSRKVAVKIIKPGMGSGQVIARFEAERQALALMDHPNIAKVLDAGTTDDGRPYFVMELVKGVSIIQYCDEHRLALRQRLELFVSVCQAVQHAHQKGIIHRDLKPTNVLVAEYDERPAAMVIDFGVAKAIGRPLTDKTMFTEFGQVIGTIEYMSPEQAKLNQLDIDTRSDIYSLGVLLYELLAGSTPFERKRLHSAAFDEMLRIIREDEFPNPSTRLSSSDSLPSIAANRNFEPKRLTGLVRGELDWIVMKALEKDRNRRYDTANGLAHDIEHYLHDEPVLARPPSAGYRFSKFTRRNKAALLTAGLVAAALMVGTVASTWQAIRATRAEGLAERRAATELAARQEADKSRAVADQAGAAEANQRALAEKKQAEAEANYLKARETVDKYFTLVSETKLLEVPGLESLRKDLLEAALEFYQESAIQRTDDPAVLVDIALTTLRVAVIYQSLDRADDFIAANRRAMDVIDRFERDDRRTDQERKLAGFWKGLRWTQSGMSLPKNGAVAVQTMLRMEVMWKKFVERYPTDAGFKMDLAYVQAMMGVGFTAIGRTKEGTDYFRKAIEITEKLVVEYPTVGRYRADLVTGNLALARNLYKNASLRKQPEEAITIARRAVEFSDGLVAEFPEVPLYQANLADGLIVLGTQLRKYQPEEADELSRRAFDVANRVARKFPDHRRYVQIWATAAAATSVFDGSLDDYSKVEQVVNTVLARYDEWLKDRPADRDVLVNLESFCADVAQRLPRHGDFVALSERLNRRAMDAAGSLSNDPQSRKQAADLLMQLAHMLEEAGNNSDARDAYRGAIQAAEKLVLQFPGDKTHWTTWTNFTAGEEWFKYKTNLETTEVMRQRVESYEARLKEHSHDVMTRMRLAHVDHFLGQRLLEQEHDLAAAELPVRRAFGLWRELANEFPADVIYNTVPLETTGWTGRHLAEIERRTGRIKDAIQTYQIAAEAFGQLAENKIQPQRDGWYGNWQADTLAQLAQAHEDAGHIQDAADSAQLGVKVCEALVSQYPHNGEYRSRALVAARFLARWLVDAGRPQEAVEPAHRQIALFERQQADFPQENLKNTIGCAYLTLALPLTASGQVEEGQQACDKALGLLANDTGTLNYFAWPLAASKDVKPAIAALAVQAAEQATNADPKSSSAWNTLGVAQYRAGHWEEAIASLSKAEDIALPKQLAFFGTNKQLAFDGFFLSMAHWQLGHKDEARKWYELSVEWMAKNQPKNEELVRFRAEAEELLGTTLYDPAPKDALPDPAGTKN